MNSFNSLDLDNISIVTKQQAINKDFIEITVNQKGNKKIFFS